MLWLLFLLHYPCPKAIKQLRVETKRKRKDIFKVAFYPINLINSVVCIWGSHHRMAVLTERIAITLSKKIIKDALLCWVCPRVDVLIFRAAPTAGLLRLFQAHCRLRSTRRLTVDLGLPGWLLGSSFSFQAWTAFSSNRIYLLPRWQWENTISVVLAFIFCHRN